MLQSTSKTLLRTQSDDRLVRLAATGSEAAFAAIVERYSRLLTRACRRVLPEARVEDAVQQTLVAAWSALRRGVEVRELRPWLLRIARNTALNALRAPGYDYEVLRESLQVTEAPPAELERMEVIRATLAGLAELPESQREALLSTAVHGTPQTEIARELGVSEGAVRQLVLRARITLRAAATAITPLPLAQWLAAPAGGGAVLAKTSAVVVLAGGMATGPALVDRVDRHRAPREPRVVATAEAGAADAAASPEQLAALTAAPRGRTDARARTHKARRDARTHRGRRHSTHRDDERELRPRKHAVAPSHDDRDDEADELPDGPELDAPDAAERTEAREPAPERDVPEPEPAEAPLPRADDPLKPDAQE